MTNGKCWIYKVNNNKAKTKKGKRKKRDREKKKTDTQIPTNLTSFLLPRFCSTPNDYLSPITITRCRRQIPIPSEIPVTHTFLSPKDSVTTPLCHPPLQIPIPLEIPVAHTFLPSKKIPSPARFWFLRRFPSPTHSFPQDSSHPHIPFPEILVTRTFQFL